MRHRRAPHSDDAPPPIWRFLDTIKIANLHEHLQTIARHGDWDEFLICLRDAEQQEFADAGYFTDAQSLYWNQRSEVEELTRQIFPAEQHAVTDALNYMEHRKRFLFKLQFVKRAADRIHAEQSRQKSRVMA